MKKIILIFFKLSVAIGANAQEIRDPDLRDELLNMGRLDQEVRERLMPLLFAGDESGEISPEAEAVLLEMREIDETNFKRLDEIIAEHGWPDVELVGQDGINVIRLLIQHADLERQRRYLSMVKEAAQTGEVAASDLARLEDRIRIREGNRQLYGSNFERGAEGSCVITPIEDVANVNLRRESVGLGSLEEYLAELERQLGVSCEVAK